MNIVIKFVKDTASSFNTKEEGNSARKLSAFAMFCLTVYIEIKHTDTANFTTVCLLDLAFILLCLGLVTFQDIIKFKSGQ